MDLPIQRIPPLVNHNTHRALHALGIHTTPAGTFEIPNIDIDVVYHMVDEVRVQHA